MINRRSACLSTLAVLAGGPDLASAETASDWPRKRIRLLCGSPAGGLIDQIGRMVGSKLAQRLGQPVLVENKVGSGGVIAAQELVRAQPDGYTLIVQPTAPLLIAPRIRPSSYGAEDFEPIAKLAAAYGLISTRNDSPFNTYAEFVKMAKVNPRKYTFAAYGEGSMTYLFAAALHKQAGIELVYVPYNGSKDAIVDLVGGRIDLMYDTPTLPLVKAGKLKALAASPVRIKQIPDVASLAEQGFSPVDNGWFGLFAPKSTPASIVRRLSMEVKGILDDPEIDEVWATSGIYSDYEDTGAFIRSIRKDSAYLERAIKDFNIKVNS